MTKPTDLIVYSVTQAIVSELKTRYMMLTVNGLDDKAGYDICKKGRIAVRDFRIEVDKQRKAYKKEALAYNRMVEDKAKEVLKPLAEIEDYLKGQEDVIDGEKERQKKALENKMLERVAELGKYGYNPNMAPFALATLDDEDYFAMVNMAQDNYFEAQRKREEEEAELAALRKKDAERDAEIRAQQEENRKLQVKLTAAHEDEIAKMQKAKAEEDAARAKAEADQRALDAKVKAEKEAEEARIQKEKDVWEAQCREKIANEELFLQIKKDFPTVELAWAEIARLAKVIQTVENLNKEVYI